MSAIAEAQDEFGANVADTAAAKKAVDDFARRQKDGTKLCPQCGQNAVKKRLVTNALSRHANEAFAPLHFVEFQKERLKSGGAGATLSLTYQGKGAFAMKKDTTLRDKNGVEIREGCLIRTKALSGERQEYEDFKVIRVRGKLSVQKRDMWGNVRTFSIAYLQRWKGDGLEVTWSPRS